MKPYAAYLLAAAFTFSIAIPCAAQGAAAAPVANPLVAEFKTAYERTKGNILKAADAMPEDAYSFSPTKDERPFSAVVAHVADAQTGACSNVLGAQKAGDAASKKTKAEVVAALKASFETCDAAIASLTDATATSIDKGRSKLGRLWGIHGHNMEQYATIAGYMRQKGVKPPTAQN